MDSFRTEVQATETTFVVRLFGELDLNAFEELDRLLAVEQADHATLTIDLSGLTFMDSTGIRAILAAHHRAEQLGGQLTLIPGSEAVQRVFEVSGVERRLTFGS